MVVLVMAEGVLGRSHRGKREHRVLVALHILSIAKGFNVGNGEMLMVKNEARKVSRSQNMNKSIVYGRKIAVLWCAGKLLCE